MHGLVMYVAYNILLWASKQVVILVWKTTMVPLNEESMENNHGSIERFKLYTTN